MWEGSTRLFEKGMSVAILLENLSLRSFNTHRVQAWALDAFVKTKKLFGKILAFCSSKFILQPHLKSDKKAVHKITVNTVVKATLILFLLSFDP